MTGGHLTSRSHQSDRHDMPPKRDEEERGKENSEVPKQTNFAPSVAALRTRTFCRHVRLDTLSLTHTSRALRVLVRYVQWYHDACMVHGYWTTCPSFFRGRDARAGGAGWGVNKLNKMVILGLHRQGTACINNSSQRPIHACYSSIPPNVPDTCCPSRETLLVHQHGISEQQSLARPA